MFTMCLHLFPNILFCNKLYTCKFNLTIGKIGLRFCGLSMGFDPNSRFRGLLGAGGPAPT